MKQLICKIKGGFANQVIQYLVSNSIAKETGRELKLDISDFRFGGFLSLMKRNTNHKLFQPFYSYKTASILHSVLAYSFSDKSSLEEILNCENNSIIMNGYWHSPEFITFIDNEYKDNLLNEIGSVLSNRGEVFKSKIQASSASVSIHVRRGDYLLGKYRDVYGVCSIDYYEKAIKYIRSELKSKDLDVFIFSNDPQWVKENFSFLGDYTLSEDLSFFEDFYLMSLCEHQIIANSSFSWLAANLNCQDNAIKISPSHFFLDKNREGLPIEAFKKINTNLVKV